MKLPEEGKGAMAASLEQSIGLLDQRVTQATQADTARLRMLLDQAQHLLEGLEAMRMAREVHTERREKELRLLETNTMLDLSRASQARGEAQASAERRAELCVRECMGTARDEQARLAREREARTLEAGEKLGRLALALEEHRTAREESGERALEGLQVELRRATEAVGAENVLRREAESDARRRMEEMSSRMLAEIQQERLEREAGQARMLSMLEETCGRIEGGMARPPPKPDKALSLGRKMGGG